MFKSLAALAALLFAGGYFAGVFGPQAYTRTVGRPPAQVMASLEDMDLTRQPGTPGSTAEAAGGVKPLFRLSRAADRMTWYVMSGDKVATAMTATFEPTDGGRGTLIRTFVERGDAPDDLVSPAFRSKAVTMGLFGMAIEGEVNKLTAPSAASPEDCQKLIDAATDASIAAGPPARPNGFAQGMAEGAKNIMRVNAMAADLRAHGCNTNDDGSFRPVEQHMTAAEEEPKTAASPPSLTPAPVQPVLDPRPSR